MEDNSRMNIENQEKTPGPQRKQRGFTLIELMIVVAIVAILASVAFPSYQASVKKSRRGDAQGALVAFAAAMERHFTERSTYEGAATGGANTGAPDIFASEAPLDGRDKFYDLTIEAASGATYTLRATPKNIQAGDGFLELLSTGARRWDENNDNAIGAGESDWK
ncbi:general secretion pathway protein H [Nitrosococcus oceani ATCC 19707]|uniref:General secretion pathway protein H n=3 Tax=Nitrosococcus oceani TaxID=1229 RepID=Q3J8W3_NITOC|nr:general secretion pathway protein H [Nitrosococcus oceani ATCC 19707]EDZ66934.1 prepilin-type N-terminal cleavage/methylation domain protein [Nitrosococcus oceani AFC27]KFI18812.1 general secretion pathway protein GspH [Nitrosococcus oceani C-27]GEM19175.1 general secretion pathway protein GspH [Nitrosococcus oceani]